MRRARTVALSVALAAGMTFMAVRSASADMDPILKSRRLLRQAFTLCALGRPQSLNASECIEVFKRCRSLSRRVRRRVCRPRHYPQAHAMAQQAVERALEGDRARGPEADGAVVR